MRDEGKREIQRRDERARMRRSRVGLGFTVFAMLAGAGDAASLNRCVAPDGSVAYTDRPCPGAPVSPVPATRPPQASGNAHARGNADDDLERRITELNRRCKAGEAEVCSMARGLQTTLDMRIDMKRRCDGGEPLACQLYACDVLLDPKACALSRGRPVDDGFEERRRQAIETGVFRISVTCLPSRIGRTLYEDQRSGRFEIRRNPQSPVVASFGALKEAAMHACHHPAP